MTPKNPLEESIEKRLHKERYVEPKKKKEGNPFNLQIVLAIAILIGLFLSLMKILAVF
ncbi:hypothetical protein HMPREF9318_01141 [Streptococcus urinalis FB127-CNA-2]|uniref:Accessory secretory protein Asp4 n=1 Tax=Streptococcus urinalis 2285-97 TaxID=764291 RepID=G5KI15_9STRE|nr:hypothetical protein [Streptococcus urinalis]EHJ56861.1 hypothetical protein STRUR_0297 [Streptococcus urinalis 2285-97]EKS20503.1 hypothetical protein HMPREF9318_01141 [Streptococcus urinalis FB127-CNA-2]VEF31196.1 Uncharacterised protein [Streptococcus urinalis]